MYGDTPGRALSKKAVQRAKKSKKLNKAKKKELEEECKFDAVSDFIYDHLDLNNEEAAGELSKNLNVAKHASKRTRKGGAIQFLPTLQGTLEEYSEFYLDTVPYDQTRLTQLFGRALQIKYAVKIPQPSEFISTRS